VFLRTAIYSPLHPAECELNVNVPLRALPLGHVHTVSVDRCLCSVWPLHHRTTPPVTPSGAGNYHHLNCSSGMHVLFSNQRTALGGGGPGKKACSSVTHCMKWTRIDTMSWSSPEQDAILCFPSSHQAFCDTMTSCRAGSEWQ
jgi:hypothetical protein